MSRFRVLLRPLTISLVAVLVLLGSLSLLPIPAVRAIGPADIATQLPVQPTEEPEPTEEPAPTEAPRPTDPPPELTDVPNPTEAPQPTDPPAATELPRPTDAPHATPIPTDKPKPRDRDEPSPTPVPPTETPMLPTATPVPTTNIRIRKVVNVEAATVGETIVYTMVVENTGNSPAADVVLTDLVPDSIDVVNLQSSKGDIVVSGQQVTAYPSMLQPGEQASYTVTGRVRASAEPDSAVENTARITTSTPGDDPQDNTSTVTFRIPVPPAAAPPVPTARTNIIFRVPRTADPDDAGLLWALLPWALLGVVTIGVGGLLAWSIASTHGLTEQMLAFMAPHALTQSADAPLDHKRAPADADAGTPVPALTPTLLSPQPLEKRSRRSRATLPPLGPLFDTPAPVGPLPPPVALDRESVLGKHEGSER